MLPPVLRFGSNFGNELDATSSRITIKVGKAADLIVLSDNLFTLPAHRISQAHVLLTVLGGREVFRDSTALVH